MFNKCWSMVLLLDSTIQQHHIVCTRILRVVFVNVQYSVFNIELESENRYRFIKMQQYRKITGYYLHSQLFLDHWHHHRLADMRLIQSLNGLVASVFTKPLQFNGIRWQLAFDLWSHTLLIETGHCTNYQSIPHTHNTCDSLWIITADAQSSVCIITVNCCFTNSSCRSTFEQLYKIHVFYSIFTCSFTF